MGDNVRNQPLIEGSAMPTTVEAHEANMKTDNDKESAIPRKRDPDMGKEEHTLEAKLNVGVFNMGKKQIPEP